MIVERTWKERTKEKLKVVGMVLVVSPLFFYLEVGQHNIILSIIGLVLMLILPWVLIPIGLFILRVDTSYYKVIPDNQMENREV